MASGITPTYLLPYPIQTDSVDVAGDIEVLAIAVETELVLKAPLSSPAFTGTPVAPTATSDTETTQIATTQYVVNQGYLKSSIASSTYAPLESAPLTGTPTAPTAVLGTDTTQIATTEYVQNELENFVTLPDQAGNGGYFLTTDGINATWQEIATTDISGFSDAINALALTYSPLNLVIQTQTDSDLRVLSLSDAASVVQMQRSTTNVVVVPFEDGIPFPIGTQIVIVQSGIGQTVIEGDSSLGGAFVTVNGTPGLKLRTRWSSATLIKTGSDSWIAMGDLSA
jgi:hypothetical protein